MGSALSKMKLEKSEVDVFFSPIARPDPDKEKEGG
jgi:hypothetical protein